MLEQRKIHDGNFIVTQPTVTHGIINGDVTVPTGQEIVVRGMINGDLIIQAGGTAKVRGMVNGSVRNSGRVLIFGMVDNLYEDTSAETHVDAGAIISGRDGRLV